MKKIFSILGLALAMLTVGCSNDPVEEAALNNTVTLGVNIEDGVRTELGDLVGGQYSILWTKNDRIDVNGKRSSALPTEFIGSTSASFTVSGVAAPYNVVYPSGILNNDGTITVPTVQGYTHGTFDKAAAVMVGHSENDKVSLHNLYSFVKLTIEKGDNVALSNIVISAAGGESISGIFNIDYKTATIEPLAGQDVIRIEGDLAWVDNQVVAVVAIPAGKYAAGFKVEINDANGKSMSKSAYSANGIEVPAGMLLEMPTIEYYSDAAAKVEITTAEQLQAFLDAVNAGDYSAWKNANGEVVLGSDIDLTDVTLGQATVAFDGVFNGQGYALTNWVTERGLFALNSGTVKNIVIDDTCTLTLPIISAASVLGYIVDSNSGLVDGCINNAAIELNHEADLTVQYKAGAIVGYSTGKVSNCVNNGEINIFIEAITASSDYFGGVVGNTSMSNATDIAMENCVNNGNITLTINAGDGRNKNVYLGGVSAACNSKGVITHCTNNGDVTYNFVNPTTGSYTNMGGITGYTACTMDHCKNYGTISLISTGIGQITRPAVAGLAGYIAKNVSHCENHGDVYVSAWKFGKAGTDGASGTGGASWPIFGGVCGCVGTVTSGGKADISDCLNTGDIYVYEPNGSCRFGIGGVVGEPCGSVTNCHNTGNIEVTGGSQVYVGGVVGFHYYASEKVMENCSNSGNVTLHGGVYYTSEGGNNKTTADASYNYAGGLVGSYNSYTNFVANNLTNTGTIKTDANLPCLVGGLAGCLRGTYKNSTNYGEVISENNCGVKVSSVCGLTGFGGGSTENCANYGNVTVEGAEESVSATPFIGIVGNTQGSHTGAIISGEVNIDNEVVALLVGAQSNNQKTITLGTAESPIVIKSLSLNGQEVTSANLASFEAAVYTEASYIGNLIYELGTTVVVE